MNVKIYVGLTLLILVIVFIAQNAVSVDIRFLFWKISMSRSLMVFFVLAIGIVIGWILSGHLRNKNN